MQGDRPNKLQEIKCLVQRRMNFARLVAKPGEEAGGSGWEREKSEAVNPQILTQF